MQRLAGNRVAQRFVGARRARQIAATGTGIRIQRVTSCTDWWATQPNPGGGEIDGPNLMAYWRSIAAERKLYLP
ncbi:MAG TPA: hypothetical protein VM942_01865, partial [Acidimicrobiales bacterium]|nr:hypothetical protein [Acidimicrobiales bacterium]